MLKLYNSLSRQKEFFRPRKGKKVNLFVCGPTVYDFAHIGHARTYIVFDMIAKYLKQKGYQVFYLQNITDIDDKIIKRAKEEGVFWKDLCRKYEREYLKDMRALNVNSINKYARATAHIKEIISQVKRLLKKDFAYQIADGIYYDISKFKDYGKLSERTVLQAEDAVSRIDEAIGKKNKGDFCLWKFSKENEPKWKSPWGWGRPGWHIEDTAITEKYFGPKYDIHGGGRDLIFPHHEAEICQMESISGKKPMVKFWLHTGFLTVKGQKMAKSLKNFVTIKNFLKNYSPRLLRFFVLSTHYRSPIDYSEEKVKQLKNQLERLDEFTNKLQSLSSRVQSPKLIQKINILIKGVKKDFEKAMEDDFNTPKAIGAIFKLVNKGNSLMRKEELTFTGRKKIINFLREIDKFFNFIFWKKKTSPKIPSFVKKMVLEREKARREKNWQLADEIREKMRALGYQIEDTKEGPRIKSKKS